MATSTTNLGLIKPAGSDKIRIAQINQNSDLIDAAVGPVGSTNLQAQANALKNGMAIVSNNNTHAAITAGQYVYVYGHGTLSEGLYVATANIGANGSLSGSNLTAVSGGGLNALNTNLIARINSIDFAQPRTNLNANNDMNSVDVGTYYQDGGSSYMPANAPANAFNANIWCMKIRAGDRIQIWHSINTGAIYYRTTYSWSNGSSSNWSDWKEIATKGETSYTVLIDERKTYDGTFSYVGASFTLTRPSMVIAYVNYNNAPMRALAIMTSSTSSALAYLVARSESNSFSNAFINAVLPAGTYYLWGQTTGNSGGNDTVVKAMAIAS